MHSINMMRSLKGNGTSQNVSRSMKCVFNYLIMTMKPRKWRVFPGLFMSLQQSLSFLVVSARLPGGWILPLETVLRQRNSSTFPWFPEVGGEYFSCPPSFWAHLGNIMFVIGGEWGFLRMQERNDGLETAGGMSGSEQENFLKFFF